MLSAAIAISALLFLLWRRPSDVALVLIPLTLGSMLTCASMIETATAGAVFYSAMTTTLSFGTLALSRHQGMHTLGVMLMIGMFWTIVANLVVLPALLVLSGISPPLSAPGNQEEKRSSPAN